MADHLFIPDAQNKEGIPMEHLLAAGNLIMDRRPDVIVNIGDFADMPSLSSYDVGKKSFEGRRYIKDIEAAQEAMTILLGPMDRYNARRRRNKTKQYSPRMVLTLGNHEDRITRAVNNDARLEGTMSIDDLEYEKFGWEVYPFLEPVEIDGVNYVHFVKQDNAPTAVGRAHLIAARRHSSYSVGHKQTLDYYISHNLVNGHRVQCLMAGSFYQHDEEYQGPQGNHHWRGLIYKRDVHDGTYDIELISMDRLLKEYL